MGHKPARQGDDSCVFHFKHFQHEAAAIWDTTCGSHILSVPGLWGNDFYNVIVNLNIIVEIELPLSSGKKQVVQILPITEP